MAKPKSEDLSDIFTQEGIQKLKKGQLLRFSSGREFIVTKINKKSGKVYARPTITFDDKQVSVVDEYGEENIKEYLDAHT